MQPGDYVYNSKGTPCRIEGFTYELGNDEAFAWIRYPTEWDDLVPLDSLNERDGQAKARFEEQRDA